MSHYFINSDTRVLVCGCGTQAQVATLQRKVADYKRNTRVVALETAEATAAKATASAGKLEKELKKNEQLLRRARVRVATHVHSRGLRVACCELMPHTPRRMALGQAVASERLKKMKAMRVEYNKLFHAVQESQKDGPQPQKTKR